MKTKFKKDSVHWATWQCATCGADMDDPENRRHTVCSNGHENFLGRVNNHHRRAFKTARARSEQENIDDNLREMFSAAIRKHSGQC